VDTFRRGLDIPGHVSWVPGGTQLNGGRLGVMIPTAVGQALGKRAAYGSDAWVLCHCGDAGWIAGHALNGFHAARIHKAPVTFVMHRNGIQLSGTTDKMTGRDPRPIVEAMGVQILETPSLYDVATLWKAYREARSLAKDGVPSMIIPTGKNDVTLAQIGERFGIATELAAFAAKNGVKMDKLVWLPGCLMSYRDVPSMLECLFLVNGLPGGKAHHDGHMKGRDLDALLANPMLRFTPKQSEALARWRALPPVSSRPPRGPRPAPRISKSPRRPRPGRSRPAALSRQMGHSARRSPPAPDCRQDASPSTFVVDATWRRPPRLICAEVSIPTTSYQLPSKSNRHDAWQRPRHATPDPKLSSTPRSPRFRRHRPRSLEMWRYHATSPRQIRPNVACHLSHSVPAPRDHFSGWSLDWINLAIGYLPYLDRFYAPADARSAFVAICDLASRNGAHVLGIPRDNLPILVRQDTKEPLWTADSPWTDATQLRAMPGAKKASSARRHGVRRREAADQRRPKTSPSMPVLQRPAARRRPLAALSSSTPKASSPSRTA
jgi:hypothetical protein